MSTIEISAMAPVSPTLSNEFMRVVSAVEPDGSLVPQYPTACAQSLRLGVIGDTPGAFINLRVYFLNSARQPMSTQTAQFVCGINPDFSGSYTGVPSNLTPYWPLSGAQAVAVKVDAVSKVGVNWQILGSMA